MTMLSSLFSRARASASARLESTTMMPSLKSAARMSVRALALLWMLLAIGLPAQAANNAAFGGQSLPTAMTTGGTYTATVIMTNNGTTTWTPGALYRLGSQNPSDNFTWMTANRVLLTSSVAPGQNGTFVFQVTAPATPGTYNFQWEMVQDFVEWFGVLTPNVVVVVSAPAPVNGAQVTGTSVPATMTQGQSYAMTVTMKNTGTTTWAGGGAYSLGTTNPFDNLVWGVKRGPITSAVAPGQQATFNIVVVAPAAGSYVMNWGMVQEFVEWFGPSSSSAVTVSAPPASAPTMGVSRNPSPMTAGQAYTLTWSSTNATAVSRVCTAASTGYTVNDAPGLNGSSSGTASTAWVGNPSSCVWRATGAGGTATFNETMTTNAAPSVEVVTYIHTDGLGSPVARTNASGQLVGAKTRYEPFGLTAAGMTPTIGFTGHVNDADTGLVYMQQRYYDPVAGRFLSIDPVTTDANTGGGFNRYAYANNSPYKYIDTDGRQARKLIDGTVALVLRFGKAWDAEMIKAAEQKVSIQGAAAARGEVAKTVSQKGPKPDTVYKGEKSAGKDLDHIIDKQLGGSQTDPGNIAALDSTVNRSLGAQTGNLLRKFEVGTVISSISIIANDAKASVVSSTPTDWGNFFLETLTDSSPTGGCGGGGKCSSEMIEKDKK